MLENSAVPYDVIAVRYATVDVSSSALFAHYSAYREPDRIRRMDYYFWVLSRPEHVVVVDTGFDPHVGSRRGRTLLISPEEALRELCVDAASVSQVILTHFHYDHVGNWGLFPSAQFFASGDEMRFWASTYSRKAVPSDAVELGELSALKTLAKAGRLSAVEEGSEIAPGIQMLELPGHTPGQLGVSVSSGSCRVILASDAAHFYDEFELDMPFHIFTDIVQMYKSLERLRVLASEPDSVVVPGHDPEIAERFPARYAGRNQHLFQIG